MSHKNVYVFLYTAMIIIVMFQFNTSCRGVCYHNGLHLFVVKSLTANSGGASSYIYIYM